MILDWLLGDGTAEKHAPAGPQLCLITVDDDFLALHNEGTGPARRVRVDRERSSITVVNRANQPFDLAPGESWTFLIEDLGPWTEAGWQLTVVWENQEEPVCVPLPAATL